jgi:glycosyltransferase involved in cell wall biosynthesis
MKKFEALRILQFIPVYKPAWRYGGPIRCVSQLCESLTRQGADVSVFTTNADGRDKLDVPTDAPTVVDGVNVRYFESVRTPWGIDSTAFRRDISRAISDFDLVHMSAMWQPLGVPLARAASHAGIPYIYSLHGGVNPWSWQNRKLRHRLYWWALERQVVRKSAALHVTCQAEQEEVLRLGVGGGQTIINVPNGIQPTVFARRNEAGETFRDSLGLHSKEKIILSLGRLNPKKGIDIFLKAAAELLRVSNEWLYVIAGPDEDNYQKKLEKLIGELGIADKVCFCGMLSGETLLGAYSAAEIFALTSYNENFGMSVVEAMAASVPVLISDQVGISREILMDEAGMVVSLERNSIRDALARMISSQELRNYYSQKGLACVKQRYDSDMVTLQIIEAYKLVLSKTRSQGTLPEME